MYKLFSLLMISLVLFSCNNSNEQNAQNQSATNMENSTINEETKIGRSNYAVIWEWTTNDRELVMENASAFTKELIELWEKDDVENVYYDAEVEVINDMNFPSISFFVKAHNMENAKTILDSLTIVKKQIAKYKIYPVGMLWLGKTTDTSKINVNIRSFVTIWETNENVVVDGLTKTQSDVVLDLWNTGKIENIYFDAKGVTDANSTTDFVFYVRATSLTEAENICKSLPYYKENNATYKIFPAGVLWLGVNK